MDLNENYFNLLYYFVEIYYKIRLRPIVLNSFRMGNMKIFLQVIMILKVKNMDGKINSIKNDGTYRNYKGWKNKRRIY